MTTTTSGSATKDNFLRIGDYVSFKFPKHQAYLSAEGILDEDVYVSPLVSFFEEHVFQIYVQRQYSATNELEEFLEANGADVNLSDPASSSYMEALTKGKENESILNRSVMKSKLRNIVCFGDTIQLLHVKSNKFLTVRPSDLARDERENMKVSLSYDGSILSWIKIMPRFKINREGEHVSNLTEVLLKVSERSNEYLHCADRPPPRGKFREVNSSLELPTGWRVSVFQKVDELSDTSLLLTGQLITIKDPESHCMLAPLYNSLNLDRPRSSDMPLNNTHSIDEFVPDSSPTIGSFKELVQKNLDGEMETMPDTFRSEDLDAISLSSTDEFIRDFGTVIMKPITEESIDSNCLWMMESKSIVKGGAVDCKNDRVYFRHLNTGKYLSLRLKEDSNNEFVLVLETEANENHSLWFIQELHSMEERLYNTRAVQIKHALFSCYLQRGTFHDSSKIYSCLNTRSKSKALSVIATRYHQPKTIFNGITTLTEETMDCYFVKAVMFHFNKFVKATEVPTSYSQDLVNATFWGRLDISDRTFFPTLTLRTTLFIRGYPITLKVGTNEMSNPLGSRSVIVRRQNMLREVGLLESIMVMIHSLEPLSQLINAELSTAKLVKSSYVEMAKMVLSECLGLVHILIKENTSNQLYISDHLLIILSHISTDKKAALIAQELLSSNRELQETKIGTREITIFSERMRVVHMNSMYLNLLRTCCSCLGQGLPRNQEIVHSVLFHKCKDVLIELLADSTRKIPVIWNQESESFQIFYGSKDYNSFIRGNELYSVGATTVKLTWKTKSHRFSVSTLYNRDEVLLSDVVERDRGFLGSSSRSGFFSSKDGQQEDLKRQVADFFISQLCLVGEMCLDRNYTVLLDIEKKYPFEVLLSILKTSNNESLKAAVAYVIHHVYINREPQSETPLPRFTRTLTEISGACSNVKTTVDFVSVPSESLHQFSLLQILISEHLNENRNRPFACDSLQMLQVLHSLVKFHYYGCSVKLSHTVKQLTDCLCRGNYDCQQDVDSDTGLKKLGQLQRGMSRRSLSVKKSAKSAQTIMTGNALTKSTFDGSKDDSTQNPHDESLSGEKFPLGPNFSEFYLSVAKTLLDGMESPIAHLVMVVISICACAVTIYEVVSADDSIGMRTFEAGILALFIWELVFHMIFYLLVNKNLFSFFRNVHNCLDCLTVALYSISFLHSNASLFVKFLRLSRLLVLYKIYYSVQDTGTLENESIQTYIAPARYSQTTEYTIKCLVESVSILIKIQKNLEDRALSICLNQFFRWQSDPKQTVESVTNLFSENILKQCDDLKITDDAKDNIFLDLLMYSDHSLVQATLDLLMMHHSSQNILLENMKKLQFITSTEDEQQFFELEKMVHALKHHSETHDIWGKLETLEHRQVNRLMHEYLVALVNVCRKRREVLKFNETYEPITFIQNILRNVGCFEVCLKISQFILSLDENEDPNSEIHKNTRLLSFESNNLLYWFTIDNSVNQVLVYSELKFFMKTVDAKIASHRVISAIFAGNIDLMELVPKKYIGEFVDMICTVGKRPQYLALMASIISVGEKNMIRNQYEVIKLMSSPENIKKVVIYFVNTNHPEYAKKIRLMSQYLSVKDVSVEDLPPDLAYHLELMQLLSSCTIGTSGMTSIEAKVQSMYHFVDIVEAMLDPNCLLLAKVRLGLFLYNAALDVETPIPAIKDAACIWKLLITAQDFIAFARDELRQIEKNGWDFPTSNRQRIEYMLVCVMIVLGYFRDYYDVSIYKPDFGQIAVGVERIQMKEMQGNEIIVSLFQKIFSIYEMTSPLLAYEHHQLLYDTLVTLNTKAKDKIVAHVENIHENFFKTAEEYQVASPDSKQNPSLKKASSSKSLKETNKTFENFIQAIHSSSAVQKSANSQIQSLLDKITNLPRKNSIEKNADVRFEPFIQKLVAHIRSSVNVVIFGDDNIKFMNPNATKSSIWLLKMFRTMIENLWGMSIYERDDDGGEEQDNAVINLMKVFNSSGMTEMCLDLIAKGIDVNLQAEALKLLVGMLFKEGGAIEIQQRVHHHLSQTGSDLFFKTVRQILHNLISWHKWNGVLSLDDGEDPQLPDEIIIVRCLQLMCEGHYLPNQDLLREQPNNYATVNLLDDFVLYLQCLDPIKCRTSTAAEMAVSAVVLEVIQGPCEGNQNYFAFNTELIETLNRKLRQQPLNDCDLDEELELKKGCIDILQALLEGQGRKTAIYERMLSVIHIDVILVLCQGGSTVAFKDPNEEESEEVIELKTESLVLLQMLTDFRPSLKVEYGLDDDFMKTVADTVACIEVVWHNELQRRFFHIPDICHALAKSSKDQFVLYVNRDSPEDKLFGLLEAAKEMYREVKHQEFLEEIHLDGLFSRTNQDRITWLNFYITCTINLLFILYYTTETITCGQRGLYRSEEAYYASSEEEDGGDEGVSANLALYASKVMYAITKIGLQKIGDNDGLYEVTSILPLNSDNSTVDTSMNSTEDASGPLYCTAATIKQNSVQFSILVLNILLIIGGVFSLLSSLVVRAPVNFQRIREKGYGVIVSSFNTALDFSLLYSGLYLMITVLGLIYHPCLSFLLLDFIKLSATVQAVLTAVWIPRRAIMMTLVLILIFAYIYSAFDFFFLADPFHVDDESQNYTVGPPTITLGNFVKFLIRYGLPQASPQNQMNMSINIPRILNDLSWWLVCVIMMNILKGITIDTFVSLRRELETRTEDTLERCFICGIEKNVFNRTLDRNAFQQHIKYDQNLWSYIYFIMFIWEQDKDDDDGFETFVRKCIANNDLSWFPMNKAVRLALQIEKGDVNSLKFRFRQDMSKMDDSLQTRVTEVKDQIGRTIGRIEKSLEYRNDEQRGRTGKSGRITPFGVAGSSRGGEKTKSVNSFDAIDSSCQAGNNSRHASSITPSLVSAAHVRRNTTVFDADILGQMHMRVVALTGIKIPPSLIRFISVRTLSRYEVTTVKPLTNLEVVQSLSKPNSPHHSSSLNIESILNMPNIPNNLHSVTEVKYRSKSMEKVTANIRNARSSFILAGAKPSGATNSGDFSSRSPLSTSSDIDALDQEQNLLFQKQDATGIINTASLPNPSIDNSVYYREKDQMQLRFDILSDIPTLVHEGMLPSSDLSKVTIKVQVVFNLKEFYQEMFNIQDFDFSDAGLVFLGGASIPLATLLTIADEGRVLDVSFIQNCVELSFPNGGNISVENIAKLSADGIHLDKEEDELSLFGEKEGSLNNSGGTENAQKRNRRYQKRKSISRGMLLIIPSSDSCSLTVSSVASHKLLQDWSFIQKNA